ncbi:M4 family metallopeptidase [Actinokineospora sp. HUAS TT18]|uniref:M4 family metallopeptidase n=1 Tax=Actinokineospora sp. HUAS TT18 TaxID=3447451 RepID=UPI003F524E19
MRPTRMGWRLTAAGVGTAVVGGVLLVSTSATAAPAQVSAAQTAIAQHGAAVRASSDDTFTEINTSTDPDGATHVHMARQYKGLDVIGGDVIVHSAPGGAFAGASLTQQAPLSLTTAPGLSRIQATRKAEAAFPGLKADGASRLVVDQLGDVAKLAWKIPVKGKGADGHGDYRHVLVDAATGLILHSFEGVHTADDGVGHGQQVGDISLGTSQANGTWTLKDPARGNGETQDGNGTGDLTYGRPPTNITSFTSATNTFGNGTSANRASAAVDAHYGIMKTWDYYKNTHNRNGIANDGVGAKSYVHVDEGVVNAAWLPDCFCMIYGDNGDKPLTTLDVAGHEMSHGVTEKTAGLVYSGESGGLNEATSDIFGTLVEFYANNPSDPADYLIGEKVDINGNGTPLRYMDDPTKDGRSKGCWYSGVGGIDVHLSSGIGNKFFYILAAGSGQSSWGNAPTCNGAPAVAGIGNDKAGKIWYRALSTYMTSNTNYSGARTATLKAAKDLYTATECNRVNAAWAAVAVTGAAFDCGSTTPGAPTVTSPGNQTGTVGTAVNLTNSATGGTAPLTWSATGLPAGLSIASGTGTISGTPTAAGTSNVTLTVTDSSSPAKTGQASFTWTVNPTGGGTCSMVSNGTDYSITDNSTIESPVTVSGCTGNASATATVAVNIVHTYIGDLTVSLIAPDGSAYVLHNKTGSGTDNINQNYTVNLSGEAANGTWKLRVNDSGPGDTGRLDTWSLTTGSGGGGGGTCAPATNGNNVNIPDNTTVESSIALTCGGNASATSTVAVAIVHTYRGDLVIDLVAPDGTAYRLKNSSSNDSADNVNQTFTVNLSSEARNGTWKLRVQDVATSDTGYIDSWTLTS